MAAVSGWAEGSSPFFIDVQVYVRANVSPAEVERAERESARMFEKAGIAVRWIACPLPRRELGGNQVCQESNDPHLFVLTIDDHEAQDPAALGFAFPFTGRANHAAAVYPKITEFSARFPEFPDSDVLASVMTHELAHLLFRTNRHDRGVMRANWTRTELALMNQRRLEFTPAQVQELRRGLQLRAAGSFSVAENTSGPASAVR